MTKPYTDEDVQAALAQIGDELGLMDDEWEAMHSEAARRAVDAVAPAIIRRAKAEAFTEIAERLDRAEAALLGMKHQLERITGKAEGVRLARSYAEEMARVNA